jgi:hypothetical protein
MYSRELGHSWTADDLWLAYAPEWLVGFAECSYIIGKVVVDKQV